MQMNNMSTKTNPKYIQPSEQNNNDIPKPNKRKCCSFTYILASVLIIILVIFFTMLGIYFLYFKKESFDQLLASNSAQNQENVTYDGVLDGEKVHDERLITQMKWDKYIKDMKFVAIGTLYDTCNETTQVTIGKVVLMNDAGTISTKTIFNITLDSELSGGTMFMKTDLNNFNLKTKKWNLCTGAEKADATKMTVPCPISEGYHSFSHVKKVPSFAPKGKYTVTSWATDLEGKKWLCGLTVLNL